MGNIKVKEFERKSFVQKLLNVVIACEHLRLEMLDGIVPQNDRPFVDCSAICLVLTKRIVMNGEVSLETVKRCKEILSLHGRSWRKSMEARVRACGIECQACDQFLTRLIQSGNGNQAGAVQLYTTLN